MKVESSYWLARFEKRFIFLALVCILESIGVGAGGDNHRSICVSFLHSAIAHDILGEVLAKNITYRELTLSYVRKGL